MLDSRPVRVLTNPFVAAALFVGTSYAIYLTSLFDQLMGNHLGHALMQLLVLALGCLFYWTLLGVDPPVRPGTLPSGSDCSSRSSPSRRRSRSP